jgi:hypothetical protein
MSENKIICPKCGHENPAGVTNCEECRINLAYALQHQDEIVKTDMQPQVVGRRVDVKESNVISRWGVLAEGQAGQLKRYYELVKQRLDAHGWPYPLEFVDVGHSFLALGKPYLETKAGKLVAYIGADSIGNDAHFSWSLTLAEPGLFKKAVAAAGGVSAALFQELTFHEINSARAFASTINHCVQEAVDIIMEEAALDKSRISREASGLLGRLI